MVFACQGQHDSREGWGETQGVRGGAVEYGEKITFLVKSLKKSTRDGRGIYPYTPMTMTHI